MSARPLRAGILAAGRGERLRTQPTDLKPLARVSGETLIERVLNSIVDTIAGPNAYADFIDRARREQAAVALALTSPGNDEKPLLVRMADGNSRIAAFGEGDYATAGVYAVRPIILREAEAARRDGIDALRKFLGRLLERGYPLAGIPMARSIDVDHPADIADAEIFLRSAGR